MWTCGVTRLNRIRDAYVRRCILQVASMLLHKWDKIGWNGLKKTEFISHISKENIKNNKNMKE